MTISSIISIPASTSLTTGLSSDGLDLFLVDKAGGADHIEKVLVDDAKEDISLAKQTDSILGVCNDAQSVLYLAPHCAASSTTVKAKFEFKLFRVHALAVKLKFKFKLSSSSCKYGSCCDIRKILHPGSRSVCIYSSNAIGTASASTSSSGATATSCSDALWAVSKFAAVGKPPTQFLAAVEEEDEPAVDLCGG